jgi:hypothetical protein
VAFSYDVTLRNNRADQITAFVGNAGLLRIYTAAFVTQLVELTCGTPFAGAASGGVLTLNAIATGTATAAGTAASARIYKADGTTLAINNMTVSDETGSGDIKLSQTGTTISSGQDVNIESAIITQGNP